MEDLHTILDALDSSFVGSIMATVVMVTGSAYKKEGAAMLFKPDGTQIGLLSGGCLEEDLAARLKSSTGRYEEVIYDMRGEDELAWGEGTGCNGIIRVWTETLDELYMEHLIKLKKVLSAGISVLMLKKCKDKPCYLFVPDSGEAFGCWEEKMPEGYEEVKSGLVFNKTPGSGVYVHRIYPKRRLIVFGAGPDARPLVAFAAGAGFSVTVSDWRPAFCTTAHFPHAENLIVGFPHEALEKVNLRSDDCIVIMTHNFKRDQELLQRIDKKKVRYLGVLGSNKRTARVLGTTKVPADIVSPAGLPIHAKGAEEIAISIVAQLIQISHSMTCKKAAFI